MTWTTTLPTQPGVYWYRNQGSDQQICELREPTPGDSWVYPTSGSAFRIKGLDGFEWQGPIVPLPEWQTELPTTPGTYWIDTKNGYMELGHIWREKNHLWISDMSDGDDKSLRLDHYDPHRRVVAGWLGPIPEPQRMGQQ